MTELEVTVQRDETRWQRWGLSSKARLQHSRQREQRKTQQRYDMQVDNSMTEKKGNCRWSRWLSIVARKEEKWKTLREKLIVKEIPEYYTTPLYFQSLHWSVTFPSLQASEYFKILSKSQFCEKDCSNTTGNMIFLKFTNLVLYCVNTRFNLHFPLFIIYMILKCYSTEPATTNSMIQKSSLKHTVYKFTNF